MLSFSRSVLAVAAVASVALSSVDAMESFLKQLPNGSLFSKSLGHSGDSGYTAFGTAFLNADTTWSTDFCKQTFPGSSMTNGEAFGDPCCTWKTGAAAPQTVTAFTTSPTKKTVCASSSTTTAPASTTSAPSSSSSTTSTTPAPASSTPKPNSNCKRRQRL